MIIAGFLWLTSEALLQYFLSQIPNFPVGLENSLLVCFVQHLIKGVQGMGGGLRYCHSAKSQMLIFKFHINLKLIFSHSLQFLEGFPATGHILLSTLKLLQLPDTMPSPGGIDVTRGSKGCLHPTCHFLQEDLKVGHFLLIDDNAAPREERIPVAIHQHTLHHRLREERPLCASTSHAWWPGTCCVAKSTVEHCLHLFIWERASA